MMPRPPAKGMVRFYHGAASGNPGSDLTQHLSYAQGYAAKGGEHGRVFYVDVPENHPSLEKAFEEFEGGPKAPYVNFTAPPDIARGLKPLNAPERPESVGVPGQEPRRPSGQGQANSPPMPVPTPNPAEQSGSPWMGAIDPEDRGVFIPPHQPGDPPRGAFDPLPVPQALPVAEPRRPSAAPSIHAAAIASQSRRSAAVSIPAAAQGKRAEEEEYNAVPWADSPRASAEPLMGPHLPQPLSGSTSNLGGPPGGGTAGDSRELIDAIEDLTGEVKRLRESIERDRPGRGNVTAPGRKTTEVEYPPVRGGGPSPSLPKRGGA